MKKGARKYQTCIVTNFLEEGESIEQKLRRVTTSNEPIENVAPMIYTERKDGVLPECDIRTDRWDVAQSAMDAVTRSNIAKREQAAQPAEPTE